jgi:DNA-binding response OmpR family regulator
MLQLHQKANTILTVDDDSDVRATIGRALKQEGHCVIEAEDAHQALSLARKHRPDVIILDITLSDMSGFELCTHLRTMPIINHTPILFLSVHQSAQYVAKALDCGGDDYLRKPFVARELNARVRALLRRSTRIKQNHSVVTLQLKPREHSVLVNNRLIVLTPTEYNLLDYLCQHQTEHHTACNLLEQLWNYHPGSGDPALVRNHIRNLRRKIETDPDHPTIVVSLHSRGYTINARIIY